MKARRAGPDDIAGLAEVAAEFVAESGYGWTFSPEVTVHTLAVRIDLPEADILVIEDDGLIVAAAIVVHARDFCVQRVGYIEKFYVRRAWRGTIAARALAAECVEWFRAHHCWAAFVTATANLSAAQDKQFTNLFSKFNFKPCGQALVRDAA